jgi:AcrR family transcriptional regulator
MSTRDRLLQATRQLAAERGAAKLTTKTVAQRAGVSEATLFKYFPSKDDLLLAVVREQLPAVHEATAVDQAGTGTVQGRLEHIAHAALDYYAALIPLSSLILADTRLLARQRTLWEGLPGPRGPFENVAAYVRAEQRLGRIDPDRDPLALASLLLGPCLQRTYLQTLLGTPLLPFEEDNFVERLVATLLTGAAPAAVPSRPLSVEGRE